MRLGSCGSSARNAGDGTHLGSFAVKWMRCCCRVGTDLVLLRSTVLTNIPSSVSYTLALPYDFRGWNAAIAL